MDSVEWEMIHFQWWVWSTKRLFLPALVVLTWPPKFISLLICFWIHYKNNFQWLEIEMQSFSSKEKFNWIWHTLIIFILPFVLGLHLILSSHQLLQCRPTFPDGTVQWWNVLENPLHCQAAVTYVSPESAKVKTILKQLGKLSQGLRPACAHRRGRAKGS